MYSYSSCNNLLFYYSKTINYELWADNFIEQEIHRDYEWVANADWILGSAELNFYLHHFI